MRQNCLFLLFILTVSACEKDVSLNMIESKVDLSPQLQQVIALVDIEKYDSARILLGFVDSIAVSQSNFMAQASVQANYGWIHKRLDVHDSAVYYYQKSNEIVVLLNDSAFLMRNNLQIASAQRALANYSSAAEAYELALNYALRKNDSSRIGTISNGLGTVWSELEDFKKAFNYYGRAEKIWSNTNRRSHSIAIHNQGDALRGMGRLDEALATYKKALKLKRDLNRTSSSAYTLTGMGRTYLLMDSVDRAEQVLNEALEIRSKLRNKNSYAETLLILSRVSSARGQYSKAERQLKEVEQIARTNNKADLLRDAFEDQRALYKKWNRLAELAEVDELYDIMTDSLYREEKLKVQEAQSAANLQREQQRTELAEQNIRLKQLELDTETQKGQFRLALAIIAFMGLAVIAWQLLQIRKRNAILVALNDRIKLITDNAFHSQKNALGLISALLRSKARQAEHEKELAVLKDVEGKIEALGGVAKSLFQRRIEDNTAVAASVQLKGYLEELVDDTFSSVASQAELDLEVADIETTSTEALNVGLIANEAVTNFSKYAEPHGAETLMIRVSKEGGKLLISFTDDGPGFPKDFDFSTSTGFGMQMMANLVADMDGSISLKREDDLTRIDIEIPLKS